MSVDDRLDVGVLLPGQARPCSRASGSGSRSRRSSVAFSRISSLVNCLLRIRRMRSEPHSGARVRPWTPVSASLKTKLGRQVVEAQRGHRDLEAHRRQVVDDAVDLGVVADRRRDEADLVRVGAHLAGAVHDLLAREAAHRKVVVAGPAEAAHAGAAARDLDHELHRHLGVRASGSPTGAAPSCPGQPRWRTTAPGPS